MSGALSGQVLRKQTIRQVRKRQLTSAAFEVLKSRGLKGTTFERVAREAGLTKGVVLHYFADKDALIEAVLKESNAQTRNCVVSLMGHCDTPWERLYAIILGNFAPVIFQKEICHAWVCLCAEVPLNPRYQRIQSIIHARMRSNLLSALKDLVPAEEAEQIAFSLSVTSDGLWLRSAMQPVPLSHEEAMQQVEFALSRLFVPSPQQSAQRQAAFNKISAISAILFKV